MHLKKTIQREPINDAMHKLNYICLHDLKRLQIRIDSYDGSEKVEENFIEVTKEQVPESLKQVLKNLKKECAKYLKTLPQWNDAEEVEEAI